jgi:hypothetical protein
MYTKYAPTLQATDPEAISKWAAILNLCSMATRQTTLPITVLPHSPTLPTHTCNLTFSPALTPSTSPVQLPATPTTLPPTFIEAPTQSTPSTLPMLPRQQLSKYQQRRRRLHKKAHARNVAKGITRPQRTLPGPSAALCHALPSLDLSTGNELIPTPSIRQARFELCLGPVTDDCSLPHTQLTVKCYYSWIRYWNSFQHTKWILCGSPMLIFSMGNSTNIYLISLEYCRTPGSSSFPLPGSTLMLDAILTIVWVQPWPS